MKILQIENKSGKLKLTDAVTKPTIDRMIDEIGRLFGATAAAEGANFGDIMNAAENAVDSLEIEINSPGGSVFDGYTIYNEIQSLRERGVEVTATVTGMAASMASVICMACNTVRMVPHGRMMIHDASQVVGGNADKLREAADLLDGISADIAGIYSKRTGKPMDEIRAMMKKETWMSAKQAVDHGFADEVFDIRAENPTSIDMKLLASLFPDKSEEIAKLEAALSEVDSLRNDLTTATTDLDAFKAEIAVKDQVIAEHVASIAARDEQIAEISATLAAAEALANENAQTISDLKAEVEATKASVGKEVVENLAAIGQPEPLPIEDNSDTNDDKIREQFAKMPAGEERSAFFAKHRKILSIR